MSSGRNEFYFPPPLPPPLLPILVTDGPCTIITLNVLPCSYRPTPEQEVSEAVRRLCEQERVEQIPEVICYSHILPIRQDGPKCGLVALSMASTLTRQPVTVDLLYNEAYQRNFTAYGEMFSVDDMAALAITTLGNRCEHVEILSNGLSRGRDYIFSHLSRNSILLVPYDADANHSPCLRNGHKAHWAAICGAIKVGSKHYLVARQGKSRHLAVWPYQDLQASNENLWELDPIRASDGRCYVLPPGGVSAGLRGRAILLHGLG